MVVVVLMPFISLKDENISKEKFLKCHRIVLKIFPLISTILRDVIDTSLSNQTVKSILSIQLNSTRLKQLYICF